MHHNIRIQWPYWILTASMILIIGESAPAEVAGRVQQIDGTVLAEATVEIWDSYPGGNILTVGVTNASGEFNSGPLLGTTFDLRVRKPSFYPTSVRNLPQSTVNASARLLETPSIQGNPNVCDYYNTWTTYLGSPVAVGDVVEAVTQDGVARRISRRDVRRMASSCLWG